MAGDSTTPLIAGLVAGIAFLVIFAYTITVLSNRVVTTPTVSLERALAASETHLSKRLPEIVAPYKLKEGERLHDFGLMQAGDDFEPVRLVFVHRNGTQFLINQTDHGIIGKCDLTDQNLCYTDDRPAQEFIKGHLIYVMEVTGRVNEWMEVGNRYMVDAINGKILHPPE